MSFFGFLSSADSQDSALSRRELLGKSLAIGAASLLPKPQFESTPPFTLPQKYPAPKFAIGDQIFSPYEDEYGDEDEDGVPEFGEVMGICWHPRNEAWEYVINWTSGSSFDWMYPVFDEFLICESTLRLVSEEICKY
jgi:hypothetical protein